MASVQPQVRIQTIRGLALEHGLDNFGAFHPDADDFSGCKTLVMLAPVANYWDRFIQDPEYNDGQPDPMDRWSERVIHEIADKLGAKAFLPYGGPPYAPFIEWAIKTGQAWESPIGMLVHERVGLMVSYRGALGFDYEIPLHINRIENPCIQCIEQPCLSACPVSALTADGYDTNTCKTYLHEPAGADCMENACAVRRICPLSTPVNRVVEHNLLHMNAFRGNK